MKSDADRLNDIAEKVRLATDPDHHQPPFNLSQRIALQVVLEPIVDVLKSIDARLARLELAAKKQPDHAGRVAEERKDKGPTQVGG